MDINDNAFMVGLIPLDGQDLDFQLPWHESLMPISKNLLAVEAAVINAAHAGCSAIFIICPRKIEPLLMKRMGEWTINPVTRYIYARNFRQFVPIYYCGLDALDINKKNSLIYSIIAGGLAVNRASSKVSRFLKPWRFFVSFPYGVYGGYPLKHIQKKLLTPQSTFFRYDGKTALDNEYLPFIFDQKHLKKMKRLFREKATGRDRSPYPGENTTRKAVHLPLEQQYSGRFFQLNDILKDTFQDEDIIYYDLEWYYNISSWDKYCEFLGDPNKKVKTPNSFWFNENKTWFKEKPKGIGFDENEE